MTSAPLAGRRRDRGVAGDRRARPGPRRATCASSAACCFRPAPSSGLALAGVALARDRRRRRSRWCCRSACPTCRSTCASTRCRPSSCCCSARPPPAISLFAAGYFRAGEGTAPGLLCLQYHVFLASMALVLLADDAYLFMVAWETMALSSYFLVTTDHRIAEIRRAGFLYLLIAHVGAIAILLCFGVLQGGSGDYTFDAMRALHARPALGDRRVPARAVRLRRQGRAGAAARLAARSASGRAFAGLGADERRDAEDRDLRPAARHLRPAARASCGGGAWSRSALGLVTALFGVVFAAVQTDMKRLLAYSSIENIGIIFAGIGLTHPVPRLTACALLAALALTAALYHCLNHAFFKSLLFLAHRLGAARHQRAQPRQARRPDPPHAVGRLAGAGRHARDRRPAAAQRLRLRMAAAAGVPVHARACRSRYRQHAGAGRRGRAGAGRRARRLRDGQVLRRHLPRPAARGRTSPTRTTPAVCERVGAGLARGRLRRCSGSFPVDGDRRCSTRSTRMLIGATASAAGRSELAVPRADQRRTARATAR